MEIHKISILLETVSFFLVTLDLYGEKRLSELHTKITSILDKILQIKSNDSIENFGGKIDYFFQINRSFFIYGTALLIFAFFMQNMIFDNNKAISLYRIVSAIFATFVLSWSIFLSLSNSVLIILWILQIHLYILKWILSLALYFLRQFKVSGVLVFLGSILFLVSKYLAWNE